MSDITEENNRNQPLEILELLERRPEPKQFERVMLNLNQEKENLEEKEGEIEEKPQKFVNDKRKLNQVNRMAVLQRIKGNKKVIDESYKPDIQAKTVDELRLVQETLEENVEKTQIIQPKIMKPVRTLVIKPKPKEGEEGKEEPVQVLETEEREPEPIKSKKRLRIVENLDPVNLDNIDLTKEVIRTQKVADRLPKEREKVIVKAPAYYMNNRKIFTQKITELFKPYQRDLLDTKSDISCDTKNASTDFDLLTHQKVVRDYLNLYTPYRGLLLYHGLGSGKTCTSIAIAEGMKSNKQVFVMTPASLKMNFFSEMKKCGDDIYRKNQYWEFVSIDGKPEYVGVLAKALSLSTDYVRKSGGAWLVNINKESNYETIEPSEQQQLDDQLNEMIRNKYRDINYNGMNENKMKILTGNNTRNPFDNSVIVIDEAHNFVSRIVNKITLKKSISYRLYDYIMNAKNAKVVLLTGTPIINYPNEIGILYNLLRGYIKTWTIPIEWEKKGKLDVNTIVTMLDEGKLKTFDNVEFSDNKLKITRNPFGFINTKKRGVAKGTKKKEKKGGSTRYGVSKLENKDLPISEEEKDQLKLNYMRSGDDRYDGGNALEKYNGVKLDESGNISNDEFFEKVLAILKKNGVRILDKQITIMNHKALPDIKKDFVKEFVDEDTENAKNLNLLQRRILGLTSYFRSAQEELLPSYVKTEEGDIYHTEKIEMTDHQFSLYEKIRKVEYEKEKATKQHERMKKPKEDELFEISSTYRIFSRAACNFAFPSSIDRPVPDVKEGENIDENIMDGVENNEADINVEQTEEGSVNEEDTETISDNKRLNYAKRIEKAMMDLNKEKENSDEKEYLSKSELMNYSPKFAKILENITNMENEGLHLLYSHFRTMEGIGIMRLILLANGFAEFKIKKVNDVWTLVEAEQDKQKPKFVLYTGTETAEEKEIIRNIYNSMWEYVPSTISEKLKEKNENNNYGEIIKVIMITSSGAEGINLRNTRFVHIVEPYWHMVRVEQVVGRARRICSHEDLPTDLRNVKVYLYIATLSEAQRKDEKHIELLIRDVSKMDGSTPVTTDETLYELASRKQKINNQILNAIKETAVDCNLYSAVNKKGDENLVCYGYGKVESNAFSSYPSFERDKQEKSGKEVNKINWQGQIIVDNGVQYALNTDTKEVYDYVDYLNAKESGMALDVGPVGILKKKGQDYYIDRNM
tara:strand:- start:4477 stop:8088 length:3612 start_codon:yes stop_codon:yes gene_type:complete